MNTYHLTMPLRKEDLLKLKAGDQVTLSGVMYTGRDVAHMRMVEALDRGEALPFNPEGAVIYYVGPTPPPPGRPIGSAGPTTSYRMDAYAPRLYALGLAASIGKGKRNGEVREALKQHGGVYFGATGGAAALLARHIRSAEVIAYPDLGPEAVRRLEVEDFPVIVIYDAHGGSAYPEIK